MMSGETHADGRRPWYRNGMVAGLLVTGILSGLVSGAVVTLLAQRDPAELFSLSEIPVHATATDSNATFAAATNFIDEDAEGLFLLDGVTGELQCVVLNHRSAKFNALFRANVAQDLGVEAGKKPEYLLVTGNVNFRGSSNARPARSVAYVVDSATGKYAAYGVPWRRELANQGRGQTGPMALLHVGTARSPELTIAE